MTTTSDLNKTNLNIIVVGSGPGGLTFAKKASECGAKVTVLEQAGDPRSDDSGYTNRSFNLTINNVGRKTLGPESLEGSIAVYGRAIHNFRNSGKVRYSTHVDRTKDEDVLMSIPRPLLRVNMVNMAEKGGVKIVFGAEVRSIEENKGVVTYRHANKDIEVSGDLVVVADGYRSIVDTKIEKLAGGDLNFKIDPLKYITVKLDNSVTQGLDLNYLHFWHNKEKTAVAIGLPNLNKTISVLLVSPFEGVAAESSPFPNKEEALKRLKRDFPDILQLSPKIIDQVIGRQRGSLYYKSVTNNVLSDACVVLGDASSAAPPWAGFGANTAIFSADMLSRYVFKSDLDLKNALLEYEKYKKVLAELVLKFAHQHGEFLNKNVAQNPEDRPIGPVLAEIIGEVHRRVDVPDGVTLPEF